MSGVQHSPPVLVNSCKICDGPLKGKKWSQCRKCKTYIHEECRESDRGGDKCPVCVKSKGSTASGSKKTSTSTCNCYNCDTTGTRDLFRAFKLQDEQILLCHACAEDAIAQRSANKREVEEKAKISADNAKQATKANQRQLEAEEAKQKRIEAEAAKQAQLAAAKETEGAETENQESTKNQESTEPNATLTSDKIVVTDNRDLNQPGPSVPVVTDNNDLNQPGTSNIQKKTTSAASVKTTSSTRQRVRELDERQKKILETLEMCQQQMAEVTKLRDELSCKSGSSSSVITLSGADILNNTLDWVNKSKGHDTKVTFAEKLPPKPSLPIRNRSSTPAPWFQPQTFDEFSASIREKDFGNESSWGGHTTRLTPDQVFSRQVTPKELPIFSGDPCEWSTFISSFIISTKRCGFSDDENILRLRQALRGEALNSVKTKLRFPELMVEVLNTLRIKYGRPDQVLDDILERIHRAPVVETDNLTNLVDFSLLVRDLYASIRATNMDFQLQSPILLRELIGKLSGALQMQWGQFAKMSGGQDIDTFGKWLFELSEIASSLPGSRGKFGKEAQSTAVTQKKRLTGRPLARLYTIDEVKANDTIKRYSKDTCLLCNKEHSLPACPTFQQKTTDERWNVVLDLKLCGKCLKKHNFRFCRSRKRCGVQGCTKTHHALVHRDTEISVPTASTSKPQQSEVVCAHHFETSNVLFRVLPVRLYGKNGKELDTFAFLDEGSSVTLMDQELADLLELDGSVESLCLRWTGETSREETSSRRVALQIAGDGKKYTMSNVRTVQNLNLQVQSLNYPDMAARFMHLRGIPVQTYQNAAPRILIGLPHWNLALALDTREADNCGIVATKSRLGWTLSGRMSDTMVNEAVHAHACECMTKDDELHNIVKDFFSLEHFGVRSSEMKHISKQDERAIKILNETTNYVDMRYEIGLLWRFDDIVLPNSRHMAVRRMICLEKKLKNNPSLYDNIRQQISEYVLKGYARRLTKEEEISHNARTWYLPLFAVSNPNKPEKLRLVWDAAAKVVNTSLNDNLLAGPDYLTPLPNVLRKFRQFKWAITGDIKEMFHQIRIREDDQDSQRFLWRNTPEEEPITYVMSVMTFGASCSPCAAHHIKNHNAKRFEKEYPRAAQAIIDKHYVDDYADSFPTLAEASTVTKQVVWIHTQAGFELRNFASNSTELLIAVNASERTAVKNLDNSPSNQAKVLGMFWHPNTDKLVFKVNFERMDRELLNGTRKPTKREVLRILMMVFDPLGLIANILVLAKILLQEIWRTNIGWDEAITTEQSKKWNTWIMMLRQLNDVEVPRCYHPDLSINDTRVDLHIFVDASENAYAAVAYFRIRCNGRTNCTLVGSKTKVAPQKLLSIPRLELQAAVLGTRLAKSIADSHTIHISSRTFWSDSTNVLGWISSDARKYKPFVAFRIGEVLESSNITEWRYIPTKVNIADTATKWRSDIVEILRGDWFNGPAFLEYPEDKWPTLNKQLEAVEPGEERRAAEHSNTHITHEVEDTVEPTRVNRWRTLLRAQATFQRACNQFMLIIRNVGNTAPLTYGLTREELSIAEKVIIKRAQKDYYPNEISRLQESGCLSDTSSIAPLLPFLDNDGLVRMKSRVSVAKFCSGSPIILPREHRIVYLILDHYHRQFYHRNNETVVNEVRQTYWIPKLRTALKSVIKLCNYCKIRRSKPIVPMMADLPYMRLAANSRPFTFTGLDYFGPIEVVVGRRVEKRWVALFTCLTVRALHLETAHSLTSDSAIMCVRRFIARRGLPTEIWSDNGTNFRRASLDLKEALQNLDQDVIVQSFDTIKWKFICPAAPHMGGAWERLVRSVKCTLSDILCVRKPSDEQLLTALAEVEHIVNSRPLTYVPIEADATEAITPNHLLLGSSSGSKSPGVFDDDARIVRKKWVIVQQFADEFWRRWTKEYLPTIMRRTKWQTPSKAVAIGDIGVLYDGSKRNSWRLGKVVEIITGKDGQVRQLFIKTSTGILRRPTSKFAVLDILPTDKKSESTDVTKGGNVTEGHNLLC